MTRWRPYHPLDLSVMGVLPRHWQRDVQRVVRELGFDTVLTGSGSTSREARGNQRMVVRVADGRAVKDRLPWLWSLYDGLLRDFCAKCFGRAIYPANLLHTAVNINQVAGRGAQYEWHVDSNPVTGLLFATTCDRGLGGSLVFRHRSGRRAIVRPRAGTFICFDARDIEHRVSPLRRDGKRISLPMNYYDSPTEQSRPLDLDPQIYTSTQPN